MTDHDENLIFEGTTFSATTGATGSALEATADLGVDNSTLDGAFDAVTITTLDIELGKFDDAELEIYRVNWQDVSMRILLKKGSLGEIRRTSTGYTAEMRSLVHHLDQTSGRLFQYQCDAVVGDQACGVNLEGAAYRAEGEVAALIESNIYEVTLVGEFEAGWFAFGEAIFETGQLAGLRYHIKNHAIVGNRVSLVFWQSLPMRPDIGDQLTLRAGCDKKFETCQEKFNNHLNFRGFPHMPGNDFVTRYPVRGEAHKGGRRV